MKFNKCYENGTFESYLEYLDDIKNNLPEELFCFVSNVNRHNFSEQSLHDSWIKRISFSSDFNDNKHKLELVFLGNQHDREFQFLFSNVEHYQIEQNTSNINLDLITFEIGIEHIDEQCNDDLQGLIVFRASFAGQDNELEIYASHITVKEIIYE